IFLGAAFIGYRTLKANADQEHISQRVNLFIKGITQYAHDFGAYPYITCANANDWNTAAFSGRVASCSALMSYIGHWLASANSGQTWQYFAWSSSSGCNGAGNKCSESATQGTYVIATPPISAEYIQAIANSINELGGFSCSVYYNGSASWVVVPPGYAMLTCTHDSSVFLSPTSPSF
ncbi:hypothetical protein, partial [Hydrogenobaculum sp.]